MSGRLAGRAGQWRSWSLPAIEFDVAVNLSLLILTNENQAFFFFELLNQ
jgi:hypothetical protein